MRHTDNSIGNFSGSHTEGKDVNLSWDYTWTMRFRILRGKLLGGFKWVNGSSATIQKTSRPERNRLEV